MHCKTCAHWEPSDVVRERAKDGRCKNEKIDEDYGQEDKRDMLIYSYSEGGSFRSGPEFGCVHHQRMFEIQPDGGCSACRRLDLVGRQHIQCAQEPGCPNIPGRTF